MVSAFKSTVFIVFIFSFGLAQDISFTKYDGMINAFILGLDEKGIEIGHEIISNKEYESVREKTIVWLADHYFNDFLIEGELSFSSAERSYTLYIMIIDNYPSSEYRDYAKTRKILIESFFHDLTIFGNRYNIANHELQTIRRKFEISDLYFKTDEVDVMAKYEMLMDTKYKFSSAIAYIDAIIVNHPEYEIYGYYQKIMLMLSVIDGWYLKEALKQSGIDPNRKIDPLLKKAMKPYSIIASEVLSYIEYMDAKYPNSQFTLEAHFMFSAYIWNDPYIKSKSVKHNIVKPHLQYIMEHDTEMLGLRYILAKEFIIKNL
jgi:hypothetical protein